MDSTIVVAPLVGYSDQYFRRLARILSPTTKLFSPMIVANSLQYVKPEKLLAHRVTTPQVVQLAGNVPSIMANAAKQCEIFGYDEININIGCPSAHAMAGGFGACLFQNPTLVGEILQAMKQSVDIPISCKIRTGIGHEVDLDALNALVQAIAHSSQTIYLHARNAILKGFSPRQNRNIPQLQPELFRSMRQQYSQLNWVFNGGLNTIVDIQQTLEWADAVMLGRAIKNNLGFLIDIEQSIYKNPVQLSSIYQQLVNLLTSEADNGVQLWLYCRHLSTMFKSFDNASSYRHKLSNHKVELPQALSCLQILFAHLEAINTIEVKPRQHAYCELL